MLEKGAKISPLFSIHGVENKIFRVDWPHSVDQGVGADFLGNLFEMLLRKLPGTKAQRSDALWAEIVAYYDLYSVQDRLKEFSYANIRTKTANQPPKLRGCNAASTRALILFGHQAAERHLAGNVPVEAAAKAAAYHLHMCYHSLSESSVFRQEVLENSSKAFALQYAALRDCSQDPAWRVKPKMHLFLELCSQNCRPNMFWTYRDEDFGGSVAHQNKMRGCWKRTDAFMKHALNMFAMKNPEPRMVSL